MLCMNSCSIFRNYNKKYYDGFTYIKYDKKESESLRFKSVEPRDSLFYGILDSVIDYSNRFEDTIKAGVSRYYQLYVFSYNYRDSIPGIKVRFSNSSRYLNDRLTDTLSSVFGIIKYRGLDILVMDAGSDNDSLYSYFRNELFLFTGETVNHEYVKYLVYSRDQKRYFERELSNLVGELSFKLDKDIKHLKYKLERYVVQDPFDSYR